MATDPRRRPMPPPPPPPPPPTDESQNEAQRETPISNLDGADDRPNSTQPGSQNGGSRPQDEAQDEGGGGGGSESYKLKFCTVCASNNNRSMEAHLRLTTAPTPYPTLSFGTGSLVRLPGPSISQPNVYNFNSTSYRAMYDELASKDPRLYRANGILPMLERNKNVKWGPERWQDWKIGVPRVGKRWTAAPPPSPSNPNPSMTGVGEGGQGGEQDADFAADKGSKGTEAGTVDVVITCEDRCWEAVVDDLLNRGGVLNRPVHVFNVDIKDNHEEALVGGRAILELADGLNAAAIEERDAWVSGGGDANGFDAGSAGARRGFDERVPVILAEWQDRWPHLPALWTLGWL